MYMRKRISLLYTTFANSTIIGQNGYPKAFQIYSTIPQPSLHHWQMLWPLEPVTRRLAIKFNLLANLAVEILPWAKIRLPYRTSRFFTLPIHAQRIPRIKRPNKVPLLMACNAWFSMIICCQFSNLVTIEYFDSFLAKSTEDTVLVLPFIIHIFRYDGI